MKNLWLCLGILTFYACKNTNPENFNADDLSVTWTVVENQSGSFECSWVVENQGRSVWGDHGWSLYYNQIAGVPLPESLPEQVVVTQISGTFFSIQPAAGFELRPGDAVTFNYQCAGNAIKISDAPTGLYMIFEGQPEAQVLNQYHIGDFSDPKQINRSSQDLVPIPTARVRYEQNENLSLLASENLSPIIPTPWKINSNGHKLTIAQDLRISYTQGLAGTAQLLAGKLETLGHAVQLLEGEQEADINLILSAETSGNEEGYSMTVNNQGIAITATGRAGIFYGCQSLLAVWPTDEDTKKEIAGLEIIDKPRFSYRGMHLDVSRNFHKPEAVKKLMDIMAFYKLNKFHFHLTDDEGWRLAIKGLPELTEVGGARGHTENELDHLRPAYGSGPFSEDNYGTGHYSRQDFIDMLQYAHARNIEVIPEINFPGHARAAIKSMEAREWRLQNDSTVDRPSFLLSDPQDSSIYKSVQGYDDNVICVCKESVYRFIEFVISDIVSIYQEAGVPLNIVHTGGDEVPAGIWEKSPDCTALLAASPDLGSVADLPNYFLKRYHEILSQHDLVTAGWEEIAMHRVEAEVGGEDDPLSSRSIMVPNPEFVDANFLAYVWLSIWGVAGEDLAYQLANRGYKVVMSNASNLYFDFAYDKDPEEPGLYWAGLVGARQPFELTPLDVLKTGNKDIMGHPLSMDNYADYEKLTEEGRKNILGIQGQLWSETVKGPQQMEYYIFPKLLALAERAWAPDPDWANFTAHSDRMEGLDQAWNRFANTLAQRDLPRMDHLWGSVNYRLAPPGVILENGLMRANVALPGLQIHFTTDGSEPTLQSTRYEGPLEIPAGATVKVKCFSVTGKSSRTTTLLME